MKKFFGVIFFLFVLISFLALPRFSLAAEHMTAKEHEKEKKERKKAVKLEEMVVTATRTETDVDSAPASVTVISKEDMKFRDLHTIDDALKYESGIYDGKLRGMPSGKHTLVMLNGMPLNTGWAGNIRWYNIAVENVERIEIVRGPSSALYGGNAMGGVINIITSEPKKFEARGEVGYGSDDTVRYSFNVGDRFTDKLSIRLGYEFEETGGYPTKLIQRSISSGSGTLTDGYGMLSKSGKRKWVIGDVGDRHEERWNVNFNSVYDLTDTGSLAFDFQMGHREYGYDHLHTYLRDASGNPAFNGSVDVGNGEKVSVSPSKYITSGMGENESPSYMLTYRDLFGSIGFIGKIGYQHDDHWYTSPTAKGSDNYENAPGRLKGYEGDTWFGDLQTNIPVGDSHLLTSGFYFRSDDFDQGEFDLAYYRDEHSKTTSKTDMSQGKDRLYAAYLQDEWQIMDKLTLFTGARFDYWEVFDGESGAVGNEVKFNNKDDSAISPKVSVVWKPVVNTVIKGSAGKAFRPPNIYELYRTMESSSGKMYYSNPDLDAETLWNYEIGVDQYFFNRVLKLSATYFHTDIKDLIYSYDMGGDSYKDNIGEARIDGIELEASARPFDWLNLWSNYTYNDSKVKKQDHDPEMEGKKITGMPVRTINLGTEISYRWMTASLMGRYTGRIYKQRYNDDINDVYGANTKWWLWETNLAVSPWEHAKLSFSVKNLFDREYFDYNIGGERSYFVEMSLKW